METMTLIIPLRILWTRYASHIFSSIIHISNRNIASQVSAAVKTDAMDVDPGKLWSIMYTLFFKGLATTVDTPSKLPGSSSAKHRVCAPSIAVEGVKEKSPQELSKFLSPTSFFSFEI